MIYLDEDEISEFVFFLSKTRTEELYISELFLLLGFDLLWSFKVRSAKETLFSLASLLGK